MRLENEMWSEQYRSDQTLDKEFPEMTIWFILSVWSSMVVLVMHTMAILLEKEIRFETGWYIILAMAWVVMLASNLLFWLPLLVCGGGSLCTL